MATKPGRLTRNGYREIVAALQARIESGQISPGNFIATEKELQDEFGAGRSTIRKVLSALVEEGWAVNVPKKGVFAGRGLKAMPGNQIAFVENDTFVQKILGRRFESGLQQRGLKLSQIGGVQNYPLEYALQQVLDGEYAGALVWSFHLDPDLDLIGRLTRELPVVALDHKIGRSETDLVTFDHEGAAFEATSHLIQHGCRRIGLTGMLDTLDVTTARIRGYMRALFQHDLQPLPNDYLFTHTSGLTTARTEVLESSLRSSSRPDGLLILQDFCAPNVVEAALRSGLSLPHDLKLSMIGDDCLCTVDGLGMTAISFDWLTLADTSLDLLKDRLQDLQRPAQTRIAPHKLIVRGLSGAPNSAWTPELDQAVPALAEGLTRPHHFYESHWRPTSAAHQNFR